MSSMVQIRKRKLNAKLSPSDREAIDGVLSKGHNSLRVIKRAQMLGLLDRGCSSIKLLLF